MRRKARTAPMFPGPITTTFVALTFAWLAWTLLRRRDPPAGPTPSGEPLAEDRADDLVDDLALDDEVQRRFTAGRPPPTSVVQGPPFVPNPLGAAGREARRRAVQSNRRSRSRSIALRAESCPGSDAGPCVSSIAS